MFSKKIAFSWRQAVLAVVVSATALLSSCKDEKEDPSHDADPQVKVTTSAPSDVVWNTVTLTIEASDDNKIAKIQVEVDGVVADTQTSSPFDFKWGTQKAAEGNHTISVTASDESGKQANWQATLKVQNTLLEFTVPSNWLVNNGSRGFVFLSDNDGHVIVAEEFENAKSIKLTAAGYNGNDFYVTQAKYSPDDGGRMNLITTAHVSRGHWTLSTELEPKEDELTGKAELSFINAESQTYYNIQSDTDREYVSGTDNTSIWLRNPSSKLYITKYTALDQPTSQYGIVPAVSVGTNTPIDLNLVNKTVNEETVALPAGYDHGWVLVIGLKKVSDRNGAILIGNFPANENNITIQYPGSDFPGYLSFSDVRSETMRAENISPVLHNVTPLNTALNLEVDHTKFTGTVSGMLDYYTVVMQFEDIYWEVLGKKDESVVLPEIPSILDNLFAMPELTKAHTIDVTAFDLDTVEDYADLVGQIRNSEHGIFEFQFGNGNTDKKLTKYLLRGESGRANP